MKLNMNKLLLAGALMVSLPAQACFFDGMFTDPFAESFPGSLAVAVATQNALKAEQIAQVEQIEGAKGLRRVSWWLGLMAKNQDLNGIDYIYMVDSQLWSKVELDGLKVHTGPAKDEKASVLLMTESSLSALVDESIDYQKALELGIVKMSNTNA